METHTQENGYKAIKTEKEFINFLVKISMKVIFYLISEKEKEDTFGVTKKFILEIGRMMK
jgi:hypothetical protein